LAKMAQGLELDCEELGARLLWDQGFQSMNGGGDYRAQVCREVNDRRIAYLRGKGVEADQLQPASELKRVAPTVPDWPNYTEVPFEQFLAFFADRYNEWSGENGARSVPDREKVILREALAHFTLLAVGEDNDSRQFRAVMRDILDTLKGGKVAESDLSKLRTFKTPVFARQN